MGQIMIDHLENDLHPWLMNKQPFNRTSNLKEELTSVILTTLGFSKCPKLVTKHLFIRYADMIVQIIACIFAPIVENLNDHYMN